MAEHDPDSRRPRARRGRHMAEVRRRPSGSRAAPANPEAGSQERARAFGDGARAERSRHRAQTPSEGSLPRAAGWTALSALIPGTGMLTTRRRTLGIVLVAVLVAAAVAAAIWYLTAASPLRSLIMLVTSRAVVIGVLVALIVVGLIWMVQVLLTNRAQNDSQHLRGARRTISTVLAVVLMLVVAVPFGLGAQRVWSLQGLLGNHSVLGGKDDHRISTGSDPWENTERLNVMLLGQDAGADRTGTRPDTIMVASIDTRTGRTALFSIPRNLQYVRFPKGTVEAKTFPEGFTAFGKSQNLINAVWSWADDNKNLFPGDSSPGLTATTHAVEQTLGLNIDYYAMVDLQGFSDLVDAIGGVDMQVERRIPIGGGTNQATGGKYPITGWIQPGQQHLDGYHALWYARSREGSNDFNRMCRQQRMVRVVTEEADPVTLVGAFPRLVTATEKNIQTNIPAGRLDAFVDLAFRVKGAGFQSYPITTDVDVPGGNNWHRKGHPDWAYLRTWVKASIDDSMKSTTAVSVKGTTPAATPASSAPASSPSSSAAESSSSSSASESSSTAESSASSSASGSADSATPVINQDPLKSCLPGGEG